MKNISVVLCTLNAKYIHSSLAPYYILAGIRQLSGEYSAAVEEGTVNEPLDGILGRILARHPRLLGVSVYIWNAALSYQLAQRIKALSPDTLIVFGGPEVEYTPRSVLEDHPYVDFVLSGEGEWCFPALLKCVCEEEPLDLVPGLSYRKGEEIIIGQPFFSGKTPPSPYLPEYFQNLSNRIAYIESSRGCPYRCAFCLSGREGNVRFFPEEVAFAQMIALAESGARIIKFVDRTFNADRKRAIRFFKFIKRAWEEGRLSGVRCHFEISGDLLDEETLLALSELPTGAVQLEVGLQSYSSKTLEAIGRKTKSEMWEYWVSRLIALGNVHVHIDLIAGLPYEDHVSFVRGFNRAFSLSAHMLQLGFLKMIPGCEMRMHPEDFPAKFSLLPPYEVYETPWITKEELLRLHACEEGLERLYNCGKWRRTLSYLLENSEQSPYVLLEAFGNRYLQKKPASAQEFVSLLEDFGRGFSGVSPTVLRDQMLMDVLSSSSCGRIPASLKREDPQFSLVKRKLEKLAPLPKGGHRGFGLLASEDRAVYCDYLPGGAHPITGEYPLHSLLISEILS